MLRLPGTYRAQGDTRLLADTVAHRGLASKQRVLDIGTGSGALALAAARAGARSVTAVDLSLRAVITTRLNARLHSVPVDVRRGDLFTPVRGQLFDLVVANPPYVPAASDRLPRHRPGRSWDGGRDGRALIDRICDGVADVLVPGGRLVLTHSTLADEQLTLERLRSKGFTAEVVARAPEPFGPVMRRRAAMLQERGLLQPGQVHEELVVVEAQAPAHSPAVTGNGFESVA